MRPETARFADYLDAVTAMLREHKLALLEALQLGEGNSAIQRSMSGVASATMSCSWLSESALAGTPSAAT